MLRLFLLCLFGWFLTQPSQAQLTLSKRLEIPTRDDANELFSVTSLAERGVLLTVRSERGLAQPSVDFSFGCYDSEFHIRWTAQFRPEEGMRPTISYQNNQSLFWLLADPGSKKITILRVSLDDGTTDSFDGELIEQLDFQAFKVMGNTAYIAGYHSNRPVALAFSFFDRVPRVLPGLYANNVELNSLELDEARQEVHVLTHTDRRGCTFLLRSYSSDGKPIRTVAFADAKNSLVSGKLLPINEDELLLVGNYSTDCTPYSKGIYVAKVAHTDVDRFDPTRLRLIPFSEMSHFFDYLQPRKLQRLRFRIDKRAEQGKEVRLRYRLLVHDLIPMANGLTLVAEVYYPQYKATTTAANRLGYYGSISPGLSNQLNRPSVINRNFDGFRYTHAFLCGFDRQGNLLWDNCLPIEDLVSQHLSPMVQVSTQGEQMTLAYPNANQIKTEVIERDKIVTPPTSFDLKTTSDPQKEKVIVDDEDSVIAWYGSYFLAFGLQKIQSTQSTQLPRSVFYVNKLGMEVRK